MEVGGARRQRIARVIEQLHVAVRLPDHLLVLQELGHQAALLKIGRLQKLRHLFRVCKRLRHVVKNLDVATPLQPPDSAFNCT
jgi:hypothetical protein